MNSRTNLEVATRVARGSLVLVGLFAVGLLGVPAARAQAPAPNTTAAKDTKSVVTTAAQTTAPKVSPASEEKAAPKGALEGIKVHGHWMIEVKNPDGTVDRHVEFENGLCLNSQTGLGGGDQLFVSVLGGVVVPASWVIELGNPPAPTAAAPLPCSFLSLPNATYALIQTGSTVQLNQASGGYCGGTNSGATLTCFPGLSVAANQPVIGALTLSGQFTVPSSASSIQITGVGTGMSICRVGSGLNTNSPSACFSSQGGSTPGQITGAYLTGIGSSPAPVTVSPNQLVSVTVQISFH